MDNPLSTSGTTYIKHDGTVDAANCITFQAAAGLVYTIYLGGNSGTSVFGPREGYSLEIATASPVPIPGAVWLFGSALLGLFNVKNKKGLLSKKCP